MTHPQSDFVLKEGESIELIDKDGNLYKVNAIYIRILSGKVCDITLSQYEINGLNFTHSLDVESYVTFIYEGDQQKIVQKSILPPPAAPSSVFQVA